MVSVYPIILSRNSRTIIENTNKCTKGQVLVKEGVLVRVCRDTVSYEPQHKKVFLKEQ
jgi:hypothetical protein